MIIFVAGIHGVGKTYLGAPAAQSLGLRHATASQLIREERGLQSWGTDKRVEGIDENQTALISAARRLRSSEQPLLLDGHFVLRGANGEIQQIDVQVFRELQIDAVLLLEAGIDVVLERLNVRGDTSWTVSELRALAEQEATHAMRISTGLGIPLANIYSPSREQFEDAVRAVIACHFDCELTVASHQAAEGTG